MQLIRTINHNHIPISIKTECVARNLTLSGRIIQDPTWPKIEFFETDKGLIGLHSAGYIFTECKTPIIIK